MKRLASVAVLAALALVPAAASAPTDYPEISQFVPVPAGSYDVANRPTDLFIKYIVIHDTEGNYPTTFSIFTNPTACCSVHYLIDGQTGASYPPVSQFVHDQDIAFHAGNFWFNQHSIGIEHDGFADGPVGYYTPRMYQRSAKLAGWIAAQYGIPIDRAHIVSHANLPAPFQALTGSMHWDPGPFWDWPYYLKLVRQQYRSWAKKKQLPTPSVPKRYRKTRPSIRTIDAGREFNGASDVTDWSSGRHAEFANVYASPPNELVLGASDPTTWTSPTEYDQRDFICDNLPNVTSAMGLDQNSDQRAKADWGEAFVKTASKRVEGVLYDRISFNGVQGWVKYRETSSGWGVIVKLHRPATLYGKPILAAADEVCPDMPVTGLPNRPGQSYVAQNVYRDTAAGITWYEIYYNHRVAWVPASEVTVK
jgi:N-acetyl-anhydromuramyl-L-alanine amidase AmpD